ncbi:hypothetical protein [Cumulibacter soli]|uniref:hypothetical protein n=1 Tax=Cumulibacter soli TaxID=2546344 RepID=UPI0010688921|nr:hypothetical protein [Cumulibacter soli]
MRSRRFATGAVVAIGSVVFALSACGGDESNSGDGEPDSSAIQESDTDGVTDEADGSGSESGTGGSTEGSGDPSDAAVDIAIDGAPIESEWSAPVCEEEAGVTVITSSTEDGGKLDVQVPPPEALNNLTVTLTPPGEDGELINVGESDVDFTDGHLTFSGTVAEDPNTPEDSHDVIIDASCPM